MEENKQKKQSNKRTSGKKAWLIGTIAVLTVLLVILIGLAVNLTETTPESQTEQVVPTMKINTPFIDLILPESLEGTVTYDVSTFGAIYTYAFYMSNGEQLLPLWRFDFGDPNMGDWVGVLKTDNGDIPVVTTLFVLSTEELDSLSEALYQQYSECMDGYNVMLNGIMADPGFTEERPLAVGEDIEMKLTYWNVMLPNNMSVSENSANGNYEAVFSGEVVGEMVCLYRVYMSDEQSKSCLGYYVVDGVRKCVTVEAFDIAERESWSDDDYAAAYRMMDTINIVIQQIVSSEHYTEE